MCFERWLFTMPLRLRSIFRRKEVERELDEELQYHIERQIQEYLDSGMPPEQARHAAFLAMGGVERRKEECRDTWGVLLIERLAQDLLYNIRIFRREPGFTLLAILSLSFVIAANTAIFQLINAIQFKHLPISSPQELVEVNIAGGSPDFGIYPIREIATVTNPLWEQIRERQSALSEIFAWGADEIIIGRGADAESVDLIWVSGGFFPALGLQPEVGRLFNFDDDHRGCESGAVVISHKFWRNYFRGEDSAIGKTLILSEKPFTVIGVAPQDFHGLEVGEDFDVALPLCARAIWDNALDMQDHYWLVVMGRLNLGWSVENAAHHLNAISPGVFEATASPVYDSILYLKNTYSKLRLTAVPAVHGISKLRMNYKTPLWLLLGVSGSVLLIACVNLANLMLAQARAREREIAVRSALGASRIRLFWQIFLGSLLLVIAGAIVGGFSSQPLSRGLISLMTTEAHIYQLNLESDWRALSFTISIAVLSAIIFGLAPSLWASTAGPGDIVKSGWRGLRHSSRRCLLQRSFLVIQIAASLALLVGSFLYVQSFRNLASQDTGFSKKGILIATYMLNRYGLEDKSIKSLEIPLLEQARSIPHVDSAATTTVIPLNNEYWEVGINIPGGSAQQQIARSYFTCISPEYFKTMNIPLLAGRDFTDMDTATSQKVTIVNERFVRRYLAGRDPIGATVHINTLNTAETSYQIIGVVKDTSYSNLREAISPIAYAPATQDPDPLPFVSIVIKSSVPASDIVEEAKRRVEKLSPDISVRFEHFEAKINNGLIGERLVAWLSSFCGIIAIVLVVIGLFGMTSYMVLSRKHEIGLRSALGATRIDMARMILREIAMIFLIGVGAGAITSFITIKYSAKLLFGISSQHMFVALFISACLLAAVVNLASYIPIYRVSRIDPMTVLRGE